MKFVDLSHKPSQPSKDGEERKFYPSFRVPIAAIKGAPTDGEEFTATVKLCVRGLDNRDKAADVEVKGVAFGNPGASKGSEDSGDTKSRVPHRSLSESVARAKEGHPAGETKEY